MVTELSLDSTATLHVRAETRLLHPQHPQHCLLSPRYSEEEQWDDNNFKRSSGIAVYHKLFWSNSSLRRHMVKHTDCSELVVIVIVHNSD